MAFLPHEVDEFVVEGQNEKHDGEEGEWSHSKWRWQLLVYE